MLSPDYLYNVSDRAVELYEQLNTFVIKDICRRLVGADFQLTGSADWQLYKLQQSGMLMDDIVTQVAQLTKKSQNEVKDIFEQATYKSQAYDNSVYKAAGLKPIDITQSPAMLQILQATYNQTMGSLYNFTQTTANQTQAEFISTMDDISMRILYGQQSYTSAISHAIRDLASAGMRVSYPSGRTLTLENAVRTAVMTGVGQATAKLSIANCEELDTDLVVVSSHPGARPSHQEWQGKVYSISGTNPKYQKLSEATGYGSVTGLCGANCRHHFSPFIEGVSTNPYEDYNDEENKERYENQQEQRRMERDIRNNKRYLEVLQESIDTTSDEKLKFALQQDYDRASAQLQEQRAAYSVYSKEHGLQLQQDRLQTAGWGRKEASRSTAGAKRYYDSIGDEYSYLGAVPLKEDNEFYESVYLKSSPKVRDVIDKYYIQFDAEHSSHRQGIIRLRKGFSVAEAHHEVGHAVTELFDLDKIEELKRKYVKGKSIEDIYEKRGKHGTIYLVRNDSFIRDYQGRIYAKSKQDCLLPDGSIDTSKMREFVSVPYEVFMTNPEQLKLNHFDFYELIRKGVE